MNSLKIVPILCATLATAGCATGTFTTRGSVTLAGDKVLLNNQFGALPSITTELDPRDAAVVIDALKAKIVKEQKP
jgi:hypothetical protein